MTPTSTIPSSAAPPREVRRRASRATRSRIPRRWTLAFAALALAAWGWTAAQAPTGPGTSELGFVEGSEVVVTEPDGGRLLGYGRVESGTLRLALASVLGDVAFVVAAPDGDLATLLGFVRATGLRIALGAGAPDVDLSAWLAQGGIDLIVERDADLGGPPGASRRGDDPAQDGAPNDEADDDDADDAEDADDDDGDDAADDDLDDDAPDDVADDDAEDDGDDEED